MKKKPKQLFHALFFWLFLSGAFFFFFLIQCAYQTINVAKNETLRLISGRHLISYI